MKPFKVFLYYLFKKYMMVHQCSVAVNMMRASVSRTC